VFAEVTIRASDRTASERFYATVLATLGVRRGRADDALSRFGELSVAPAQPGAPVTRRLHLGFAAPSRAHVDAFWRAGTAAGHRDDGPPGPRPQYTEDYYGAFLLDPDGNSAEALHYDGMRPAGTIDHVWLRVADVAASKAFYATIAPRAGLELGADRPERVSWRRDGGSLSVLGGGAPTANVQIALVAARAGDYAGLDPDGNTVAVVGSDRE
jgi:catechol 2,3-dioxygenase-like lactoylglutathione lyase family enzyme